ncbi:ABC transporter ATP-binding protein [Paludibacter sp.]|uniref:ATP-binding cassette domain-containing protein n=1 Tax=Paludibacter sp. TaxID=1898105 RepID=UPI00135569C3|nr:ABC transporter ATP-binding protein [Paludibacter sp.]MTK54531.1 ABC transporter ATP-binding protein [Paludibacter sp.]
MQNSRQILHSFSYFYRNRPLRLIGVFVLALLLGLNQGISIVMLIPLLSMLDKNTPASSHNQMVEWMKGLGEKWHFSFSLEFILIFFVVLLLIIALLGYLKSQWQSEYEQQFIHTLRSRLFRKIVLSDWQHLTRKSRHTHIQILSSEIPKLSVYYFALMNLITSLILIGANIALSFLVSVKFTFLVLLVGAVCFLLLKKFILRSLSLGGLNIAIFRQMSKQIDDFWTMVKQAKVHNAEAFYYQKYSDMNARMFSLQRRQNKNRALSQFVFTITGIIGLVVIIYTGYRVDSMPLTSIFVLILLFGRLFPLFTNCNNYLDMMATNIQSVNLVIATDNELEDKPFGELSVPSANNGLRGNIRFENITFAYRSGNPVFEKIRLEIPNCAITGIVGQSGKGKTTLLDLLTGLLQPTEGVIHVGENQLQKHELANWRQHIGYLTQDVCFVDGTIRENLVWDTPYKVTDEQIMEMLSKVDALDIVLREKEGLSAKITNFQYHFSGGERQRLALARILLRFPKLLLLDEATSALDKNTEAHIMQCLSVLKQSITIVFVTHRESLMPYFDHVVDLDALVVKPVKA